MLIIYYIKFMYYISNMNAIIDFVKILELKRYSKNTVACYQSHIKLAKLHFSDKPLKIISNQDLFEFIYYLVNTKKISASYQWQIIGALKLFYKEIYGRNIPFEYLRVKRLEKKSPVVFGKQEIRWIIECITNLKHKAIISLLYGSGLRIGELLNLKKADIDSERMLVHVRGGKGKKDRYTVLSNQVLEILREYYQDYNPQEYIFEGRNHRKYSNVSAGQVFKRTLKKARVSKHATLQTLRHSFATHLLEDGIGINHIQKLLGHNNINSTLIYTQIAKDALFKIKSPLDV